MLLDDLSPIFQDSVEVPFLMIERPMNNEHVWRWNRHSVPETSAHKIQKTENHPKEGIQCTFFFKSNNNSRIILNLQKTNYVIISIELVNNSYSTY